MAPKRKADENEAVGEGRLAWSSYYVPELKAELTSRGLSVDGKKADLVARLESDDNAGVAEFSGQAQTVDRAADPINWKTFKVSVLKDELKTRGLVCSGKKDDLVARLEACDNSEAVNAAPNSKRAKNAGTSAGAIDVSQASTSGAAPAAKAKQPKKKAAPKDLEIEGPLAVDVIVNKHTNRETGERRERGFVPRPDEKFKDTYWRIQRDRMFMLDRRMSQDQKGHTSQKFEIAGSTGNIYNVTIGRTPSCDCPDAKYRGNKCKHINYALIVILKAPVYLQYQLAFMSDEVEAIFANAPVTRAPELDHDHDDTESVNDGTRKPIEGDCPICVFPMEAGEEELVWCKASCGQNFHKECFDQWKTSKNGGRVTCVYCRAEWQEASPKKGSLAHLVSTAPQVGQYRNIGHHAMYHAEAKAA